MKKILLATTILGMSAGYAAADISWSASAAAGFGSFEGDDFEVYSSMEIGVKGSAETDSGLTFSAATDLTTGTTFNRGGDLGDDEGFGTEDSAHFGMPTITIGGAFGTVTFSDENIDFYDDAEAGDVKYEGTFGAITAGMVYDIHGDEYSVKLGYAADGIAVSVDTDSYDQTNASASYTMGAITGTLTSENDDGDVINHVKLAYAADAISASIELGDDETWDLSVGYTANGLTVTAETDDAEHSSVIGSYDLGAGLTIEAGADSDENAYLGAAMKF